MSGRGAEAPLSKAVSAISRSNTLGSLDPQAAGEGDQVFVEPRPG